MGDLDRPVLKLRPVLSYLYTEKVKLIKHKFKFICTKYLLNKHFNYIDLDSMKSPRNLLFRNDIIYRKYFTLIQGMLAMWSVQMRLSRLTREVCSFGDGGKHNCQRLCKQYHETKSSAVAKFLFTLE